MPEMMPSSAMELQEPQALNIPTDKDLWKQEIP